MEHRSKIKVYSDPNTDKSIVLDYKIKEELGEVEIHPSVYKLLDKKDNIGTPSSKAEH